MQKLREGENYLFVVDKMTVAPDGSEHFVLTGPDGKKYLLPANLYSDYNIEAGSSIKCRIDKINCRGEVFIEPEHPCYAEGRSYPFRVVKHEKRTDPAGTEVNVFIVTDRFGNKIPVPSGRSLPAIGTDLSLEIERISKARIFLVDNIQSKPGISLRAGRRYPFTVERIATGLDGEEYFIVRDNSGIAHSISRNYYGYYGFRPGSRFMAKIVKYRNNGEKIIEPDNPFYKTGSVIRLRVTGVSKNGLNDSFTVDLLDSHGFTHCIETVTPPESDTLRCRVLMIRKGKPLLKQL